MIEKELKYLLTEDEYYRLLKFLKKIGHSIDMKILENYYFDTKNFDLLNSGVSLRLRSINGKSWEFTYKCKVRGKEYSERKDSLLINEELNNEIKEEEAMKLINHKKSIWDLKYSYLKKLKKELPANNNILDKIKMIGHMQVSRLPIKFKPYNIPLEIDKIFYGDEKKEFELESETKQLQLSESVITKIFSRLNIEKKPALYPKIIRLLINKGYREKINLNWT
ncbi:MAG: CYTH domain-containing protein [Candidatus Mcinerneyibacterium aminivorans]|uniref:CYTH domain-containing protein n=1 Tax=Candidatus Mcinerneyibacterium aminivorans TaxID=2703815 RepID=A0A5D0MB46_9BACT|nr:MAG: CYTH domain-containing protein [Candidatus Mcinerneyibacterium aminivorans]